MISSQATTLPTPLESFLMHQICCPLEIFIDTLPETNIAPKNGWLEYYFPIGKAYFQGRTVSFREGKFLWCDLWEG